METQGPFEDDGEVLVIEVDGKAIPTATAAEMQARRGPRKKSKKCGCGLKKCQRHRGKKKRKGKGKKKRKKRGHNGKSAVLAAIYTLRRGDDGKLHKMQRDHDSNEMHPLANPSSGTAGFVRQSSMARRLAENAFVIDVC